MDRIAVGGSVHLDEGFGAAGRVTARRARIDGDFDASGASFDWLGEAAWGDGVSLVLDRARIEGTLALREQQAPLRGASLVGTCVGTLADDTSTWGDRLALDGFTYSRFDATAPMDTQFRIAWLERQQPAHLSSQFRPQPWRRLIRVLRRMGHERDADSVAVRREMWLRRVGRIGAWAPRGLRWVPQLGHAALGLLAGYGHRPGRVVAWMVGVWLACGIAYWAAGEAGADAAAADSPFAYSLDRILPWIDLDLAGSGADGMSWPDALRWLSHFEASFGLVAVLLLAASLAGWVDRDRRR